MGPVDISQHQYSHLSKGEDEASSFIHGPENPSELCSCQNQSSNAKLRKRLSALLCLVILVVYTAAIFLWKGPVLQTQEGFDAPADAPIEYKTVKFNGGVGNDISAFQGPSNPQTDAAWAKLLNVGPGMIGIDDETAGKLRMETAKRVNGSGYVGVVEMFHQLHCLDRIRIQFYNRTRNDMHETEELLKLHTEHCFDYLRQTLMCHGDVAIMSMAWDEREQSYTAKFDVEKQCRNFDKIASWTKEHQTGWWPPPPA